MRYIIFIYIRYGAHHLKMPVPKVRLAPQGSKRLLRLKCALHLKPAFAPRCALNNYEFMIHHVSIYRKPSKYFNKEKKLRIFSFYNIFDAYETKVKMRE